MTDLAGNVTTTNLSVALDYAAATSPVLEVVWPTNGTHLAGDSFYVRGNISDETASVVAESVDANGVTNVASVLVERNGMFWVEGLPLGAGTNEVRLIATSAAGKLSSTNLSVVKSDVSLTIDSTPEGESLYAPSGAVYGTVSDPAYGKGSVLGIGNYAVVHLLGHGAQITMSMLGQFIMSLIVAIGARRFSRMTRMGSGFWRRWVRRASRRAGRLMSCA